MAPEDAQPRGVLRVAQRREIGGIDLDVAGLGVEEERATEAGPDVVFPARERPRESVGRIGEHACLGFGPTAERRQLGSNSRAIAIEQGVGRVVAPNGSPRDAAYSASRRGSTDSTGRTT